MSTHLFGMLVTWALLGTAWVMVLIHCLYVYGNAYVHDEQAKEPPNKFIPKICSHDRFDTFMLLVTGLFIGAASGALWFIAWPVIFCVGLLRGARTFVRFQTSYKAHKHDKETGEIA